MSRAFSFRLSLEELALLEAVDAVIEDGGEKGRTAALRVVFRAGSAQLRQLGYIPPDLVMPKPSMRTLKKPLYPKLSSGGV